MALWVLLIMNCNPVNRFEHQKNKKNTEIHEIPYQQHNKAILKTRTQSRTRCQI